MAHAAKKLSVGDEIPIDLSRARLVRRGPGRTVRLSLRTLREAAGLNQSQVSKKSGLAQPEISKLENAPSLDDRMISTVRRYLAAIGVDLDLVSVSKLGHRIGLAPARETQTEGDDRTAELAHAGIPASFAVERERLGEKLKEAAEAIYELLEHGDGAWKEAVIRRGVAQLFLNRVNALGRTPDDVRKASEATQALMVIEHALDLLVGRGDADLPERIRLMHEHVIVNKPRAIEHAVSTFARAIETQPEHATRTAFAFVKSVEQISGRNLSRAAAHLEEVVAVLRRWRKKPNTRRGQIRTPGVMAEVYRLAGEPGNTTAIRKRHGETDRRRRVK